MYISSSKFITYVCLPNKNFTSIMLTNLLNSHTCLSLSDTIMNLWQISTLYSIPPYHFCMCVTVFILTITVSLSFPFPFVTHMGYNFHFNGLAHGCQPTIGFPYPHYVPT